MDIMQAIKERHSVRSYTDEPISDADLEWMVESIAQANHDSGLDIQLRVEEPAAFVGGFATYGAIKGARNYLAMVGPKGPELDELCGYYGERLVLEAQMHGLNTVWLGLTYNKSRMSAQVGPGQECPVIIVVGHGADQGRPHKVKELERLCLVDGAKVRKLVGLPRWFTAGLEAAQLAPSAINQQKFAFDLVGGLESTEVRPLAKKGPYCKVDLGIARLHFELGANSVSTDWSFVQ